MSHQTATDPTVLLELAIRDADTVMTRLARTGETPDTVDTLYRAVSGEADRMVARFDGCFDFWPNTTTPMPLSEPAILGNTDGTLLSVLIPGAPNVLDAATIAIDIARESGAIIDSNDPALFVDIHPARWMILNTCESPTHDFHPELAPHAERSPGAVLVTRVTFTNTN